MSHKFYLPAALFVAVGLAACGHTDRPGRPDEQDAGGNGTPVAAAAPQNGEVYALLNDCSGKALDVEGVSTANGANVHVWTPHGGANQQFRVVDVGGGYHKLVAQHSGKVIDVNGGGVQNGTNVQQWSDIGSSAQHWKLIDAGNDRYKLEPRNAPGKALDVSGAGIADGTNVQIWTANSSCAQRWTLGPAGGSEDVQAKMADSFVDGIGMNTHLNYFNTAYGNAGVVKDKLIALGVRYIRDAAASNHDHIFDLHKRAGIKLIAGVAVTDDPQGRHWMGTLVPERIPEVLNNDFDRYANAGVLLAIENPNERAINPKARDFAVRLYQEVKSRSNMKNLPMIGPSVYDNSHWNNVGDVSAHLDICNIHSYPGGAQPTNGIENNLNAAKTTCAGKVGNFWVTETGYHNALYNDCNYDGCWGHPAVSERAMAKYVPRNFAVWFARGSGRTFQYEFVDEFPETDRINQEQHFGLLRNDLTEKPAYWALRDTVALLKDPGAAFQPGKLNYTLQGDLTNVRQVLLQKRDGRFYLLLWQEVPSYSGRNPGTDLEPAERTLTLKLGQAATSVKVYRPTFNGTTALSTGSNTTSVTLKIPDHLTVVEVQ